MSWAIGGINCVGDIGYSLGETTRAAAAITAANIKQAAAAIIAVDNANQLVNNYRDQRDIARRGYQLQRQQQDHLKTVFWPREAQFLAEFSTPEDIETVEAMGVRYGGRLAATVAGLFAEQLKEAKCASARYCTSANAKRIQDLLLARSVAMGNARVLGRNIAFAEFQARTDTNYERRMQAVALGRGLMQQAATLYASAGAGLASSAVRLSGQLSNAMNAFGVAREQGATARAQRDFAQDQVNQAVQQGNPAGSVAGFGNNVGALIGPEGFGLASTMEGFSTRSASQTYDSALFAGDTTGLSETGLENFNYMQNERQMNEGDVGNRDLVRTGTIVWPVVSVGAGAVAINIDAYGLMYADDQFPRPPIGGF